MKIYSISSNYKTSNSNCMSLKETQNVNIKEYFPKNSLIGVPKSYISFGDSNRISDAKRKAEIAKYLECKTKAKDIERGEEYYKERVQSRIDAIVSERSHYGRFSGNWKVGKVKKVERARIEKEEYAKYLQEKAEYKKVMDNEAYYKGLVSTEDIEIYEKSGSVSYISFCWNEFSLNFLKKLPKSVVVTKLPPSKTKKPIMPLSSF